MDGSISETLRAFRKLRKDFNTDTGLEGVKVGAILAVGMLLGGGYPGAAASIAYLAENHWPDNGPWPWSDSDG
jgi:hypothetical protein